MTINVEPELMSNAQSLPKDRWYHRWPAVVITAGIGATLLWGGMLLWLAWSFVSWVLS